MKKRALALFLALSVMISASSVFAADFEWEANVSETQVRVGDVFNVDLDITANPGIQNATIDITYDPTVVIPVSTVDPAEDIIGYPSSLGVDIPLFDYNYIDGIINNTSVETGNIRIANYTTEADEENALVEITETGTLARITFKAVGSGDAKLALGRIAEVARTPKKSVGNMAYSISIPSVTVSGGDNVTNNEVSTSSETTTTEPTTASATATTVTTTKSDTSSSSSGSSTVVKATTTTTTTTATTTEAATETTTAAPTRGSNMAGETYATFNDLADYPWAESYIRTLAQAHIVNGYNDGTFKPGNNVKRADFIIMLLKAMGIDTAAIPQSNFSDVSKDKYYYNAVGLAKEIGIASGNPDGTFNPESNITRQDMMILAKKAVEMKTDSALTGDEASLDRFADKAAISPYAVESLAAMVEAEIVSGTGDNIQPKDNTTRAQAAVIICKIRDLMK